MKRDNLIITKTVNAISIDNSAFYYEGDTVDIKFGKKNLTGCKILHINFNHLNNRYEMIVATKDRMYTLDPQRDITDIHSSILDKSATA